MKILYITTIGSTMKFFNEYIKELVYEGNTVDIACNDRSSEVPEFYEKLGCRVFTVETSRFPFDFGNLRAISQIKKIVETEQYDIVHCHTPIAAACTRVACRTARKSGTRVIYTAHGFHFYKGAPILNWLIFYPIEWLCSWWTDILISINKEDYEMSCNRLHANKNIQVSGVGFNFDKVKEVSINKTKKREELRVSKEALLLVSVGEINSNKNHEVVIRALYKLQRTDIVYLIAGIGELSDSLSQLIKELGLENQVRLLGYRGDVLELYACADVCVFPSLREGLGMAAIEGIAMGLPLICGDNRGTREYAIDGYNAFVCKDNAVDQYVQAIERLYNSREDRIAMGSRGIEAVSRFDIKNVNKQMKEIYFSF